MDSQKTSHTSPLQTSYGAPFLFCRCCCCCCLRKDTAKYRECTLYSWQLIWPNTVGTYHQLTVPNVKEWVPRVTYRNQHNPQKCTPPIICCHSDPLKSLVCNTVRKRQIVHHLSFCIPIGCLRGKFSSKIAGKSDYGIWYRLATCRKCAYYLFFFWIDNVLQVLWLVRTNQWIKLAHGRTVCSLHLS